MEVKNITLIVDHRRRYGRKEYRVRWSVYGPDDDTWETTETLHKVRNLIEEYEDSLTQIQLNHSHLNRKRRNNQFNRYKNNHYHNPDRVKLSLQCNAQTNRGYRCKSNTKIRVLSTSFNQV